jgi:hypothetical protein
MGQIDGEKVSAAHEHGGLLRVVMLYRQRRFVVAEATSGQTKKCRKVSSTACSPGKAVCKDHIKRKRTTQERSISKQKMWKARASLRHARAGSANDPGMPHKPHSASDRRMSRRPACA